MRNLLYAFLLIGSSLFLGSCSNDSDTTPPTIEILKPEENQVFKTGDVIDLKIRLTDEYGIAAYAYQIFHDQPGTLGEFSVEKEFKFNSVYTSLEDNHSEKIPLMFKDSVPTAVGDYNLRVIAVDIYNNRRVVDQPLKIVPAN